MKCKALLLALTPALLGLLAGAALELGLVSNPIFVGRIQVTMGLLVGAAGILVSVLACAMLLQQARHRLALERAAAAAQQAQEEAHRRFVRRLDHELKNPLTAIQAGLTNLERNSRGDEAAQASLANLRRQMDRLAALTRDLRKLADLESCDVEWAPVDLGEIIAEAVELAQALPGTAGRTVKARLQEIPWPLSPLETDRDLLLLALYNLIGNAYKFSPPGATVEVRAGEDGARVNIEVADNGPGIAAEDLPHLGEELYRGRGARGIEGSGLGLALVKRVVARLGGELDIRSRQGRGTVVTMRLPLRR